MKLWLSYWSSHWQHLLWRLGMIIPMLFSQYADADETHEEREVMSLWKLLLLAAVVLGLSVWSFFL